MKFGENDAQEGREEKAKKTREKKKTLGIKWRADGDVYICIYV